ncbi:Mn2+/Fe2+ NRAMP family transporter [Virgibacillus natechei]|uniref:Mn2+/Fe2+ NRAMP family transporter n=1 Tax=Virgibacillus natechei TaxID=1216297 RepID=A0ABS4IEI8_9BACI|nr:Nramp family divalent metal transporter [Virgibacillus natechei]MBP1969364.1 Mn2+/Fe2+ NRAMP family transporter [Virgibacillus natechei]UZD12509.1 Nramp family divalent metal transporter [Virgibacillus natechei]
MSQSTQKKSFKEKLKIIGPSAIISASFIGPGTITTATQAGASYGYALLWAVVFSVITTMVLQMMVARLGIIAQKGLGAAIRDQFENLILKYSVMGFVLMSIFIGCAAYMSGDLNGTSLGIATLTGWSINVIGPIVGIIVLLLGISGSYKLVEKLMIVLVIIMSIVFITTMIVAKPDLAGIFSGVFAPSMPPGSIITIIALIGTTVVPYNLFIHSSSVQEKWNKPSHLKDSRWDIFITIGVGGLITAAVLITSGTLMRGVEVETVADLALQLEPLLGSWAETFLAIGIFSAGFSSTTASALGAAMVASSMLKWENGMKNWRFKTVFGSVILIGILSFILNFEPLEVLLFAQALNGILLPGIAILIMVIMNNKKLLGNYRNSLKVNVAGSIIVIICLGLGTHSLITAIGDFIG